MNLKEFGRKPSLSNRGTIQEGQSETKKSFTQNSRCPSRESNGASPEYKLKRYR
jgi:hypothetical protein